MKISYRKRIPEQDDLYLLQLSQQYLSHYLPAWMWKNQAFLQELNRSSRVIILLGPEQQTIGYVAYSWISKSQVHFDYAVIEGTYQGKGYARQGLEALEQYLKGKGATSIHLYVHGKNKHAMTIYYQLGFRLRQRPTFLRPTYWMEMSI